MNLSERGIAEIISHEGIVPFRYRDSVGVDTFGVGHTASAGPPDPREMKYGDEHPLEYVIDVFRRDIRKFEARVNRHVKAALKQHEFDALVSFDFNTGRIHNATLTKRLNDGNTVAAIKEFDRWVHPPEIRHRRMAEKDLFATARYSNTGRAMVFPADDRGRVMFQAGKRIDISGVVSSVKQANEADGRADRARNATAGSAAGAGAAGFGEEWSVALGDGTLYAVAAVLVALGGILAWRWWSSRREAKRLTGEAAGEIVNALEESGDKSKEGKP